MKISVYDDKLYIANVGMLPEAWTLENLINKHVSLPFNPNIAHTFYLAGFIKSWGRGVEKIRPFQKRVPINHSQTGIYRSAIIYSPFE